MFDQLASKVAKLASNMTNWLESDQLAEFDQLVGF
jgi:hypothetical protein